MLQYVNAFSSAYSADENNLVLHFQQDEPVVVDGSGEIEMKRNDVASIIMNRELATALLDILSDAIQKQ